MASRYFALAVIFGTLTTFLSILALSLDYWQGKTLLYKDIPGIENIEKQNTGEGRRMKNVKFNSVDKFNFQTTSGPFSDMNKVFVAEAGKDQSQWMNTVINIHGGIWHLCVKIVEIVILPGLDLPEACFYLQNINIPDVYFPPTAKKIWIHSDWEVTRAMLFLGLFCIVASVACVLVRWFMLTDKSILLTISANLALIAGIFFMAGFSVFADTMKLEILDYQSAFYFCVLSWLLAWTTAGVTIYIRMSNKDIDIA